jgi:hypothetical protein
VDICQKRNIYPGTPLDSALNSLVNVQRITYTYFKLNAVRKPIKNDVDDPTRYPTTFVDILVD